MNVAVILAGGVGQRVGAGIPKQFIDILGKPILAYTIEPFEKHPDIDAILVVCVKSYIDYIDKIKEQYGFSKLKWVTEGGETFQDSVLNGVKFLSDKVKGDDIVLFHFSASPFIKSDIITDTIEVCKKNGTNAISSTDYFLLSGEKGITDSVTNPDNFTDKYINRDTIAVMNTPHAFKYSFIAELYDTAAKSGVLYEVEPHTTTLMYALNKRIFFSKGSQTNIKITTKEDLELFTGYVLEQQRNTEETVEGDVVIFFSDGFEECEGLLVVDLLRRAGLKVIMASVTGSRDVKSSRDILVQTDCLAENVDFSKAKMIVLPGGRTGTENLKRSEIVIEQCRVFAKNKYVAAICAAPIILAELKILDNKKATVHPDYSAQMCSAIVTNEMVVVDNNIITGQALGASIPFALELIRILLDSETSRRVSEAICFAQ